MDNKTTPSCPDFSKRLEDHISCAPFSGLLKHSPDGVIIVCSSGKICAVNPHTEALFGYTRNEMIGKDINLLVPEYAHGKHDGHIKKYFSHPFERELGSGIDLFGRHKDGSDVPLEICLSPITVEDEWLAIAFIRDIGRRKKAEKELRKLNLLLEEKIRQRTEELELANEELSAFCYSISHDLRAPLTGISGFTQILSEDYGKALEPQAKEYLSRISQSSRHMEELIDGLLTLFRVTQDEIYFTQVDLSKIADRIISDLRARDTTQNVMWCKTDGLLANGDPRLLHQVMESLLSNAWKYTEKKIDARLEFGVTTLEGKKTYYVRDNGCGFDMNYAEKLFVPFQRLHGESEFPGNGIGLATVKRIIHRHGGSVWGEGVPGQGATFYFRIP